MQRKELKRLSRMDLIELLIERQAETERLLQELEETRQELEETREALAERLDTIDEAGSIAEAALSLSGIFEKAQKAADEYLDSIEIMREETVRHCKEMEEETRLRCRNIVQNAKDELEEINQRAKKRKWK